MLQKRGSAKPDGSPGLAAWDRYVVVALVLLAAGAATLAKFSEYPDGDSLLQSIMSVQKPTMYYWGQNRLGSFLPMLASPIHNIEANFYFQLFCRALSAALTPAFVISIINPRMPLSAAYAAALAGIFLLMSEVAVAFYWIHGDPYALSLAFVWGAVLVLRAQRMRASIRYSLAVFGLVMASWVNVGIVIVTGPLFALLALFLRSRVFLILLLVTAGAYALETLHLRMYEAVWFSSKNYVTAHFNIGEQLSGAANALERSLRLQRIGPWHLQAFAISAVLTLIVSWRVLGFANQSMKAAAAILIAGIVTMALTSALDWVRINQYHWRYFGLALTLMVATMSILVANAAYVLAGDRPRRILASALALLAAVAIIRVTDPRPLRFVDPGRAALADIAVRSDIHLIAGDYWTVWPVVFEAIQRRGSTDTYGLTWRGEIMLPQIRKIVSAQERPRVLCVGPTPDDCLKALPAFPGRPIAGELRPLAAGSNPDFAAYELNRTE